MTALATLPRKQEYVALLTHRASLNPVPLCKLRFYTLAPSVRRNPFVVVTAAPFGAH